jgi:hypothetical protein
VAVERVACITADAVLDTNLQIIFTFICIFLVACTTANAVFDTHLQFFLCEKMGHFFCNFTLFVRALDNASDMRGIIILGFRV